MSKPRQEPNPSNVTPLRSRAPGAGIASDEGVEYSPDKQAALAGLERWKEAHEEVMKHLEPADVLVDSMRGQSTTWTRVRVNLVHVPQAIRPEQGTPDPDDDPTRQWREAVRKRR